MTGGHGEDAARGLVDATGRECAVATIYRAQAQIRKRVSASIISVQVGQHWVAENTVRDAGFV